MIAFNVIPATYFNDSSGKAGMTTTVQQANIDLYSTYTINGQYKPECIQQLHYRR